MCNKHEYLHFILDLLFSICGNQVLSVGGEGRQLPLPCCPFL